MGTTELLYPPTHAVTNQVQPLEDYNVFTGNQALRDALKFNAPDMDTTEFVALGKKVVGQRRCDGGARHQH